MNPQMYNRFVSPATVTVIEVRRSEWLGPVRMGGERWGTELVEGKRGGRSKKERSRFSWVDDVTLDLRRIWV